MKIPFFIFFLIASSVNLNAKSQKRYFFIDLRENIINQQICRDSSDYNQLFLKSKSKADSILKEHFEPEFYRKNIYFSPESSYWLISDNKRVRIGDNLSENPQKLKLVYAILKKDIDYNLIEFTFNNAVHLLDFTGIPEKKNYRINVDYEQAAKLAVKKGFKLVEQTSENNQLASSTGYLYLDFTDENTYKWVIEKEYKRRFHKQSGLGNSYLLIYSKVLYIDAETGKRKIKKQVNKSVSIHWF